MKWQKAYALQSELQKNPRTISSLVAELGGLPQLMSFFRWMYDDPEMIYPILLQGDDIDTNGAHEYQGQPVVWDGTFIIDAKGELVYQGYRGASGFGGNAKRVVKITDQVMAG